MNALLLFKLRTGSTQTLFEFRYQVSIQSEKEQKKRKLIQAGCAAEMDLTHIKRGKFHLS